MVFLLFPFSPQLMFLMSLVVAPGSGSACGPNVVLSLGEETAAGALGLALLGGGTGISAVAVWGRGGGEIWGCGGHWERHDGYRAHDDDYV